MAGVILVSAKLVHCKWADVDSQRPEFLLRPYEGLSQSVVKGVASMVEGDNLVSQSGVATYLLSPGEVPRRSVQLSCQYSIGI